MFGYFDQRVELQAVVDDHRRLSITHLATGLRVAVCGDEAQAEAIIDALMQWRAEFGQLNPAVWNSVKHDVRKAIEERGGSPT
jgi:predicted RNA polymerase sigma factor